jgi:hypothetical protein
VGRRRDRLITRSQEALLHFGGLFEALAPPPRRWVVERTFAWLGLSRRLSKDYERLPETGEAIDLRRYESTHAAGKGNLEGVS